MVGVMTTDVDRRWALAAAAGMITNDTACAFVSSIRDLAEQLEASDPELAAALAEGDERWPDDARRQAARPSRTVEADPEVAVELARRSNGHYDDDEAEAVELRSWRFRDLTAAYDGDLAIPPPTILRRSDGKALFYEGACNYLHGDDGVGKSLVALLACVDQMNAGRHVVWCDWEDPHEGVVVARLGLLGVPREVVLERFHYLHPDAEASRGGRGPIVRAGP